MFFVILFMIFSSSAWSMDVLGTDKDSWSEGDEVASLLRNPQDFLGCVIDLEEPCEPEKNTLPREMWWIIAAHSGDEFYRIALISREINGHIKFLLPHLVLPNYPSVWNVLDCLKVIEKCEKAYEMLEGCGLEAPSLPAYRSQVKKLTDAEIYVKYAPVFLWDNGHKRLELLRGIHNLDKPEYPDSSFRIACSSFARDRFVSSLSAAAVAVLTLGGLYHIYSIWPGYLHEKNLAHLKYLQDYQRALNHTSSEEFPQSLLSAPQRTWPSYFPLDISQLFQCYKQCGDWYANELSQEYGYNIILPWAMCKNPNLTSPDYMKVIENVTSSISRVCGQNMSDLWSPWITKNLWNSITSIASLKGINTPKDLLPSIAKMTNQSTFFHVSLYDLMGLRDYDGIFCFLNSALYTYDPVCIARQMVFEQPTFPMLIVSAWGATAGVLWLGFFMMMLLGWCL